MEKSNKKRILKNTILIVEGKSDVCFLNSFIDTEFFITNGSDIKEEKIKYLKKTKENGKRLIILTDPDFPGDKIRNEINQKIPGCQNIYLPKEKCIKHGKVGVAECDKETILFYLDNIHEIPTISHDLIEYYYLVQTKLSGSNNSSKLRDKICEKYGIGKCNSKTMIKRLNSIGISINQFKKDIEKM